MQLSYFLFPDCYHIFQIHEKLSTTTAICTSVVKCNRQLCDTPQTHTRLIPSWVVDLSSILCLSAETCHHH